jgi:hypothetical protein
MACTTHLRLHDSQLQAWDGSDHVLRFAIDLERWEVSVPQVPLPPNFEDRYEPVARWRDREAKRVGKVIEVTESGRVIASLSRGGDPNRLAFAHDGRSLLSTVYRNKTTKLWDVDGAKLRKNLSSQARHVFDFEVLTETIAVLSRAGLAFFDPATGKILVTVRALPDGWICFAPDGRYELCGTLRGSLELGYVDNAASESLCFVPDVGFLHLTGRGALTRHQTAVGGATEGLLAQILTA